MMELLLRCLLLIALLSGRGGLSLLFPCGRKDGDNGNCLIEHFHSENVSWIWNKPRENNSFYTLYLLNESPFQHFSQFDNKKDFSFFIPLEYITGRYSLPQQHEIFQAHPKLLNRYYTLLSLLIATCMVKEVHAFLQSTQSDYDSAINSLRLE